MNNADKFKQIFDLYATELWAMSEKDFLAWLNAECDVPDTNVGELISKQAAINAIENTDCELLPDAWDELTNAIMKLPTAEPKRGKWIYHRWDDEHVCSVCRHPAETIEVDGRLVGCNDPSGETGGYFEVDTDVFLSPYCPYCGAQMENPAENILDEDECEE